MKRGTLCFFYGLALTALALMSGCDLSSSDDVVRNVGADYTGQYSNGGAPIISRNTGGNITSFNLRQNGSNLEAVDNNGIVFRGSVSQVIDGEASFTLKGRTTAGAEGTVSGILRANGTSGTMSGTWIESTVFGDVTATGSIRGVVDSAPGEMPTDPGDGGVSSLSLSPSGTVSIAVGASQTFTTTGGSGSYSWAIGNNGIGSINRTSGTSVTYTSSAAGTQTLSVNDGSTTRAATVSQN